VDKRVVLYRNGACAVAIVLKQVHPITSTLHEHLDTNWNVLIVDRTIGNLISPSIHR